MAPFVPNQPCGTRAAYVRHKRAGEKPCEPCRLANNKASRERTATMGKFVTALPMTPEFGTAPCSDALDDALVWNCRREAEAQGYHPADGEPRLLMHEHQGDWWRSVMINVAEDAPLQAQA